MARGEKVEWDMEMGKKSKMHQEIIFNARRAEVQTDQSKSHDSRNDDSAPGNTPAKELVPGSFHMPHLKPSDKREFSEQFTECLLWVTVILYSV